jgi:hypothetical protein
MKRILILLILIIPTLCFSQVVTPDSKYATGHVRSIKDSVDRIPIGLTGSNDGKRISITGQDTAQIRYNKADSSIYVHTGTQFIKVGGGGGGAWGTITGTLSDQTDLQAALDLKLNISDSAAMLASYIHSSGWGLIEAGQGLKVDTSLVGTRTYIEALVEANNNTPTLQQVLDAGSILTSDETINAQGNMLAFTGTDDVMSIANTGAAAQPPLFLSRSTSATSSPTLVSRWDTYTTGTAAAGFGGQLGLAVENAAGNLITTNQIDWKYSTATGGNETTLIDIKGMDNGSYESLMEIQKNGIIRVNNYLDTLGTMSWVRANFSTGGGGTQNLSWDATNHEVDISGGGTSAIIPFADLTTDGLLTDGFQEIAGNKFFSHAGSFTHNSSSTTGAKIPLDLVGNTTGTPEAGIGTGWRTTIESLGGNQIGATFEAIMTDVTDNSEDVDFVIKLMAGGSAAAERFRFISTGQLKLPLYTTTTSFTVTPVGMLVFDANGNIGTQAISGGSYTNEEAQDAVGTILNTNTFNYDDATPAITLKTQMSITSDASGIKLSGDAASPGNTKYYGTNSVGTKGFYDLAGVSWSGIMQGTAVYNTSQTLATGVGYDFDGASPATFTLPSLSTNFNRLYFIKNRGSATLTVARDGTDNIYTTSSVTSFTLAPGEHAIVRAQGSAIWSAHQVIGEVDGSTSNELQTINNTSDATSHTVTLSNSGGTIQFIEGTNITLTTGGTGAAGTLTIASTGSGFTNLTQFVSQTAHRLFYSDASGDVQELAFGTSGQYLKANGLTTAPSWDTPAGSGTVNAGAALKAAYYPSAAALVDDWIGVEFGNTNLNTKIIAQATTEVGLQISLADLATANAFEIKNSGGTNLMKITADGEQIASTLSDQGDYDMQLNKGMYVANVSATEYGLIVSSSTGTADVFGIGNGSGNWVIGTVAGSKGVSMNSGAGYNFNFSSQARHAFTAAGALITGNSIGFFNPDRTLHVYDQTGTTNAVVYEARFEHSVFGTQAIGSGVGIEFKNTGIIASTLESVATDITGASEDADIVFKTLRAGTLTEAGRFISTGSLKLDALANDNAETNLVVWNATDKVFEYRTVASLPGGGGGSPGSPVNSIQYNSAGAFAGSANLTYDASLVTALSAGLGVTQDDAKGIVLINTTAAAAGAQQISPAIRWSGQGWKTTATAASQEVEFRAYVLPTESTTAPVASWVLEAAINGGGYGLNYRFTSNNSIIIGSGVITDLRNTTNSIVMAGSEIRAGAINAVVFTTNGIDSSSNTFMAGGQNSVIQDGAGGAVSLCTDCLTYSSALYSVLLGDANKTRSEASLTAGFGNLNAVRNGIALGNTITLGQLGGSEISSANKFDDSWAIGSNIQTEGHRNGTLGYRITNTGKESIVIGSGYGGSNLNFGWSNAIGFGTLSDSATLIIKPAAGATGTYGETMIRGALRLPNNVYNSGEPMVALVVDTLTGLVYRKTQTGSGGATLLNLIDDANAAGTVAAGNFDQTWTWNTLGGKTGFALSANTTAAASNAQILFSVALSGANSTSNQITQAVNISNVHTGTGSENYGLSLSASGGATRNIALFIDAGELMLPEMTAPGTPPTGYGTLYEKTDGLLYFKNDAGTEFDLTAIGGGSGITIGTTTITSGTNTRVLFNNSGVVGEYVISGTGNVAMTTNAVFTTPNLGTPSAVDLTNATSIPAAQLTGSVATARLTNISQTKGIKFVSPTASESQSLAFNVSAMTVTAARVVVVGSSPSVTYTVHYGTTYGTPVGTVIASNTVTTTGTPTLNVTDIPANSYMWVTTSATSGTVNDFSIFIIMNQQ